MKSRLSLCLLALASTCWAQPEDKLPRNTFQFSPQHLLITTLHAGVEHFSVSRKVSYSLSLYGRKDLSASVNEGYNGLGAEGLIKRYVLPMKAITTRHQHVYHRGLYLGGLIYGMAFSGSQRYYYSTIGGGTYFGNFNNYKIRGGNWGAGFTMGYQIAFWEKLFFDLYVGGAVQWARSSFSGGALPNTAIADIYSTYITDPPYVGVTPRCGVKVGVGI